MISTQLTNSIINAAGSKGPPLFTVVDGVLTDRKGNVVHDGGLVIANLDGYAIIPVAEYENLIAGIQMPPETIIKIEPKDNNGREDCFWCGAELIKTQGFSNIYSICPNCRK